MIKFDEFGNLIPYQSIISTIEEIEELFTWNERRKIPFNDLHSFFIEIKNLEFTNAFIWINGSFTTNKSEPNDIDLVLFTPYLEQEKCINILKSLRIKYVNLDLYFVNIYPENHNKYFLFEMDKLEWNFQFTQTRKNHKTGKSSFKGFIQINL